MKVFILWFFYYVCYRNDLFYKSRILLFINLKASKQSRIMHFLHFSPFLLSMVLSLLNYDIFLLHFWLLRYQIYIKKKKNHLARRTPLSCHPERPVARFTPSNYLLLFRVTDTIRPDSLIPLFLRNLNVSVWVHSFCIVLLWACRQRSTPACLHHRAITSLCATPIQVQTSVFLLHLLTRFLSVCCCALTC